MPTNVCVCISVQTVQLQEIDRNRIGGLCSFARLQLQTPHIQLPKDAQFIPLLDLAFTSARSSMRVLKTSGPCTGLTLNMPKRQTGKHMQTCQLKLTESIRTVNSEPRESVLSRLCCCHKERLTVIVAECTLEAACDMEMIRRIKVEFNENKIQNT